jgi:hypothetical protein
MGTPLYTDERIRRWIDYEIGRTEKMHSRSLMRRILFRLAVNIRDHYEDVLRQNGMIEEGEHGRSIAK